MRKLKHILVGVDGAEAGFNALRESIRLAHWTKGGVTVITVAPSYEGDLSLVGVRDIKAVLHGPCEEVLTQALETAEEQGAHIRVICEEGQIHEKIVERAETEQADLIVLGCDRRPPLMGFLSGGVATRVIQASRRDVLIVPCGQALAWNNILVAGDGSETSRLAAEQAIDLALSFGGRLSVLHLAGSLFRSDGAMPKSPHRWSARAHEWIERIRMRAQERGVHAEGFVRRGLMSRAIVELVRKQGADMIVLAPRVQRGLPELLPVGLAERISRRLFRPVFIPKALQPA